NSTFIIDFAYESINGTGTGPTDHKHSNR
ncbi:unnamed protein product, partial [Rotaria sp. Silwood1]